MTLAELEAVTRGIGLAVADALKEERQQRNEELRGYKAIASALGCSERQVKRFARQQGLPLRRDPIGVFVKRWLLDLWRDERTVVLGRVR